MARFFTSAVARALVNEKDERNIRNNGSKEEDLVSYCEFCGIVIENNSKGLRVKYCSKKHQQTAARRRMARRLDVPAKIDRFDPLYFS